MGQAGKLLLLVALAVLLSLAAADPDPWKVLGVRRSATRGEITRAFRRLSREWHPDKNRSPEATERFQQISAAYDVLTDPSKAKVLWEAPADVSAPGSTLAATFGTLQFVLDLDPNRLRELLTTWSADWAAKNWDTFGPLWQSPVDRSICWGMENAWRLPKLTEPVSKLVASYTGAKHREGAWRGWRLSGALLEFSAWSSRQAPCLQQRLVDSTSTQAEVLAQLHQQLQVRRRARQAAVAAAARRSKRARQGSSSEAGPTDSSTASETPPISSGSSWQSCVVWGSVLVVVAGWSAASGRRALQVAPVAAAAAVVFCMHRGVLLPDESALQQLAAILQADGMPARLLGVGFVLFSMAVALLLPALLAGTAFMATTWLWAAASTLALASTPAVSQASLALWMLAQVYFATGGGDPIRSVLVVLAAAYGLWKMPRLFKWWFSLLSAPVVLGLAFCREVLRGCGLWRKAAAKAAPAPEAAAQQAAAAAASCAAVERAAEAPAAPAAEDTPEQQPEQQGVSAAAAAGGASAGTDAVAQGGSAGNTRSSSSSRKGKGKKQQGQLLPAGAWWPRNFGPVELAVTCHWYTSLLGWHLAGWALSVAAISCKLTVLAVLFALTSAALGAPLQFLTLRATVQVLLLRAGAVAGLVWRLRPLLWH